MIINITDPIFELEAIAISVSLAAVAYWFWSLAYHRVLRGQWKEITPRLRVQESISKLSKASKDIDNVIRDVLEEMEARQGALDELMKRHDALSKEERELTHKVEALKQTPIEVAEYFQEINSRNLQQAEKKRARRDFYFLLAGILLTAGTTIVLKILGFG
jgi:predicted transcriptional regulator